MINVDYPELVQAVRHAHQTEKRDAVDPINDAQAIRIFLEFVHNVHEDDYGDFMRKVNVYIRNLRNTLQDQRLIQKVSEMQFYTQFSPTGDIAQTRARLLEDGHNLLDVAA